MYHFIFLFKLMLMIQMFKFLIPPPFYLFFPLCLDMFSDWLIQFLMYCDLGRQVRNGLLTLQMKKMKFCCPPH